VNRDNVPFVLPSEIRLSVAMAKYFGDPDADAHLRRPEIWTGKVIAAFRNEDSAGDPLPWPKTHAQIRVRSGEVSLWPGISGHGKSIATSQVALHLVSLGRRVAVASLEMQPWNTLKRMARQAAGSAMPAESFLINFCDWLGARQFLIYDQHGRAEWRHMANVVRYAAIELGVQHFLIDSLMMCVAGEDDYNGQKDFVTALCSVAHDTGCHIHLVHHARKLRDESDIPGKFDARGSGTITDQVDNVFTFWRNKAKEIERENAARVSAPFDETANPDALLICDKQRNGEWEGRVRLWWDGPSMSYRGVPERPRFLGYEITAPDAMREPGADEDERDIAA